MSSDPITAVRAWLRETVVGLELCPFAASPLRAGRVRLAVSAASAPEAAISDLLVEARALVAHPQTETTLLCVPSLGASFEDFLDLTALAEDLLADDGMEGILQLVAFHPDFRFAGAAPHDPANAVNRSPVPLWHLLREESIARVVAHHPDVEGIPERNAARLRER